MPPALPRKVQKIHECPRACAQVSLPEITSQTRDVQQNASRALAQRGHTHGLCASSADTASHSPCWGKHLRGLASLPSSSSQEGKSIYEDSPSRRSTPSGVRAKKRGQRYGSCPEVRAQHPLLSVIPASHQQHLALCDSGQLLSCRRAKHRVFFSESQQRAVECQHSRVPALAPLGPAQARPFEGDSCLRVRDIGSFDWVREGSEVPKLLSPALRHQGSQLWIMVCEKEKRAGGSPFLAHEEQRRHREKQEEVEAMAYSTRKLVLKAVAERAVANLVVVLDAIDKGRGRQRRRRFAARDSRCPLLLSLVRASPARSCAASILDRGHVAPRNTRRAHRSWSRATDGESHRPRAHSIRGPPPRPGRCDRPRQSGFSRGSNSVASSASSRSRMCSATVWMACMASRRRPSKPNSSSQ